MIVKSNLLFIQDQEISWAGMCPWTDEVCYGTQSGKLFLSPYEEAIELTETLTDAINGVAFSGDEIAITTRNEVYLGYRSEADPRHLTARRHPFKGGAHGVVSSSRDAFVAPLGVDGLLIVSIQNKNKIELLIGRDPEAMLNFYKVARIEESIKGEVFVCAGRHDGLLIATFDHGRHKPLEGRRLPGFDIVDVCPVGNSVFPRAAMCVSRNRSLFLFKDVLNEINPIHIEFDDIQGTVYSMLSVNGQLFLLTDREFIGFPDLVKRLLGNESLIDLPIKTMPCDASDAFLLGQDRVSLVEDTGLMSLAIDELLDGSDTNAQPRILVQSWPEAVHHKMELATTAA